jgi:hypothetical protein
MKKIRTVETSKDSLEIDVAWIRNQEHTKSFDSITGQRLIELRRGRSGLLKLIDGDVLV